MAIELKSFGDWKHFMEEGGMNEFSVKKAKPLSERNTCIAIFVLPALFLYIIFTTLSILPWFTGMVLAMAEFFVLHHIITCVLLNQDSYVETVNQSPYISPLGTPGRTGQRLVMQLVVKYTENIHVLSVLKVKWKE
ncbi:hypothetical protein BKA82DRAFT_4438233 [Pisolithus tinctorius]|nr:hypothetical protein BKA82DRAFT_4438233 [Pisolithus tinctorius]